MGGGGGGWGLGRPMTPSFAKSDTEPSALCLLY